MKNGNTATDTKTAQDYFGIPATEASAPAISDKTEKTDYQSEVNRLLKETKVVDGKFEFADDVNPWAKVAISNEKKFRDTQSGYTTATQDNKLLEAEVKVLKAKLAGNTGLSDEQNLELDNLKVTDPDAYFTKRTQFEAESAKQFDTELSDVRHKTSADLEMERRTGYLETFNSGREVKITNELLSSDVPPKFYTQLESGKVTFEQFLDNVAGYLDAPKVAGKKADEVSVTNLSDVSGGDTPSGERRFDSLEEAYSSTVF